MTHFNFWGPNDRPISGTAEAIVTKLFFIRLEYRDNILPHNGRGQDHVTRFFNFAPIMLFGIGEARHFKFRVLIDTESPSECMTYYSRKGCVGSYVTSLNFGI